MTPIPAAETLKEDDSSAAGAAPIASIAEAIEVACRALDDWSHDLAATRDEYIDAMSSGSFRGRRIRKEMAKFFAHDFGEHSSAVFGCIDVVRAAFAQKQVADVAARDGTNPSSDLHPYPSEMERLREALQPFAKLADEPELAERFADDYMPLNVGLMNGNVTQSVIRNKITVADVRRARAALLSQDAPEQGKQTAPPAYGSACARCGHIIGSRDDKCPYPLCSHDF